ncbi:LysM peptidoglycan-binding domain-containing protein [Kitasatospora sp. KL5]|uniref:LysM peptidoglycan-binding domain-containing protein n=1 Tax=Kitasatospora sp. KL5 TaxID=3425125 RepID=UPI003D6F8579
MALLALVGGIPYGLVRYVGWPLPHEVPTLELLREPITTEVFVDVLAVAVWLVWAQFLFCVLVELRAAVSGIGMPVRVPAAGATQALARKLVSTMLFVSAGATVLVPTLAGTAVAAEPTVRPVASATATAAPAAQDGTGTATTAPTAGRTDGPASATAVPQARQSTDGTKFYRIQPPDGRHHDTLWDIAQRHLGDGRRYQEIFRLNKDRLQPDGAKLSNSELIRPGWILEMPADAVGGDLVDRADLGTAPATADGPAGHEVVVHPGDTLSGIAQETLGDGDRYPELFEANQGRQMADGRALTDPDLIFPGWKITLPSPDRPAATPPTQAPATQAPTTQAPATQTPAARTPATQAPAVQAPATQAPATQAPTAQAPAPATQAPTTQAPTAGASSATAPASSSGTDKPAAPSAPASTPEPSTVAAGVSAADSDSAVPGIVAAVTWGGMLAAGVVSALALKRRLQQRNRASGRQVRLPRTPAAQATGGQPAARAGAFEDPAAGPQHTELDALSARLAEFELRMRATEDPQGAELVDRALRTLAARVTAAGRVLPALAAARLTPGPAGTLSLHLQAPDSEPLPPFALAGDGSDPCHWVCPATGAELLAEEEARQVCSPYPALATLGREADGSLVLANLEAFGVLLAPTDPADARAVLRAIAVELATAPWSDDLSVLLVGLGSGLTSIGDGYGRLAVAEDLPTALGELRSWARVIRTALADSRTDSVATARSQSVTPDAWTPKVVLSAEALAEHVGQQELTDTLSGACAAIVAAAAVPDDGVVRLPGAAGGLLTLGPLTCRLTPQRLDEEDYAALLGLFGLAAEPAPESTGAADPAEPLWAAPPVPAESGAAGQPEVPEALPETSGPQISLLGHPVVTDTAVAIDAAASARLTEIAAWIALHPGAEPDALAAEVWPSGATLPYRSAQLSALRRWLGTDAEGGQHLPAESPGGLVLGPEVGCDWQVFRRLAERGFALGAAGAVELSAALALVRGRPFDGVPPRRYAWVEYHRQLMVAAIVDVAVRLAELRLAEGDRAAAREAVDTGLTVEPGAEVLYRLGLQAADRMGDRAAVESYAIRLDTQLQHLNAELQPATAELLHVLADPSDPRTAYARQ